MLIRLAVPTVHRSLLGDHTFSVAVARFTVLRIWFHTFKYSFCEKKSTGSCATVGFEKFIRMSSSTRSRRRCEKILKFDMY